jgi:hypothetical protein
MNACKYGHELVLTLEQEKEVMKGEEVLVNCKCDATIKVTLPETKFPDCTSDCIIHQKHNQVRFCVSFCKKFTKIKEM